MGGMDDGYSRTFDDDPALWTDGASYLVKTRGRNGQRVVASGWHLRQIRFEMPELPVDGNGVIGPDPGDIPEIESFEAEFVLDDHGNDIHPMLAMLVGDREATVMEDACRHDSHRISANRDACRSRFASVQALAVNMPSRSGDPGERLREIPRWCRIFDCGSGTVTIYEPLTAEQEHDLRWPHYGIWLNRGRRWFDDDTPPCTFAQAVATPLRYLDYNLGNWIVEEAQWRSGLYLSSEYGEWEHARLEFGVLAAFARDARLAVRNAERRILTRVDDDGLHGLVDRLDERVRREEETLRDGAGLLSVMGGTVSTRVSYRRSVSAERTNGLIELLTAVFLIPSLVIAFFSMSIIAAPDDARVAIIVVACVFVACIVLGVATWLMIGRGGRRPPNGMGGGRHG